MVSFINWEIIHVPEKPPFMPDQQPTVDVFACEIDPKNANTLVRKLNQIAPLEDLRHVKRVRKMCFQGKTHLSLLLCLASGNDDQSDSMPQDVVELVKSFKLSTFITKVCKYAALSKEEWEEQCKLWPTSYHPPTYNIDGITGFSEVESQSIFNFMKLALDMAKSGDDQVVNAAVIVDPSVNQIIASARDEVYYQKKSIRKPESLTCEEPNHKFISKCSSDYYLPKLYTSSVSVSCLFPRRWAEEQQLDSGLCYLHPLQHAAITAIGYSAARDRLLFPTGSDHHIGNDDHAAFDERGSTIKRQKVESEKKIDASGESLGSNNKFTRPYLCTGYDIFLVWEPCPMCAMALVHQRIRRIFYAFPNPKNGALGSVHRLQGEKSLNHHYAVFRIQLPLPAEEKDHNNFGCN